MSEERQKREARRGFVFVELLIASMLAGVIIGGSVTAASRAAELERTARGYLDRASAFRAAAAAERGKPGGDLSRVRAAVDVGKIGRAGEVSLSWTRRVIATAGE